MKQLIPATSKASAPFAEDRQSLCKLLEGQGNDATWYTKSFNPYPLIISQAEWTEQLRLQSILHKAITAVVRNYLSDQRISKILSLGAAELSLVQSMCDRHYRIGSYRPDFVHDTTGAIKVCEINARFATNAYFISHYLNNVVPKLNYLNEKMTAAENLPEENGLSAVEAGISVGEKGISVGEEGILVGKEGQSARQEGLSTGEEGLSAGKEGLSTGEEGLSAGKEGLSAGEEGYSAPKELDQLVSTFISRICEGAKGNHITIVRGREKGWDIKFLLHELSDRGFHCRQPEPETLQVERGRLVDNEGEIGNIYLELHQDEFVQRLSPEVLKTLACCHSHLNDLRTIYLVHDKRFLAVLYDRKIMVDYLYEAEVEFLQSHLVPTYALSAAPEIAQTALKERRAWVLKPNLLGKGEGIVFGKDVSDQAWANAMAGPDSADYVLQRLIEQKQFSILNSVAGQEVARHMQLNVVGTLLCFDDMFFGPGIYRASPGDIVNVAGGGTVLFPLIAN